MRDITTLIITAFLFGCTATPPYGWLDTRVPAREDATADLEECRVYTAKQYRPGMPAGDPFLKDKSARTVAMDDYDQGTWRPDRSPFPITNINAQPIHNIPVDYTGYPGELDYYPNYLDEILEKCMSDRGWIYQPITPVE